MNNILKKGTFVVLLFCGMSLAAEEIHLIDGNVLHGSIKGSGDGKIIYKDEATFQVHEIMLDRISRIIFEGGIAVDPKIKRDDRIHRKDGTIYPCKVLRIEGNSIALLREDDIIPRTYALEDIEKVVYGGGNVVSFSAIAHNAAKINNKASSEAGKTQHASPTHHIDGKANVFFLLTGGFGITKNSDVQTYSEEMAERYRLYLENKYGYTGYRTEPGASAYNPDINIEIEVRLFFDSGIGIGLLGGLSFPIYEPIDIVNSQEEGVFQVNPIGLFSYAMPVMFYKYYFTTYNAMAFYVLAGAGAGICYGMVDFTVTEGYSNQNYGTPDAGLFEQSFSGKTIGYLGLLEIGVEESNVTLLIGMKMRHAVIEKLTDGEAVMRLNNGNNAHVMLNGAYVYAGIGVFI